MKTKEQDLVQNMCIIWKIWVIDEYIRKHRLMNEYLSRSLIT